MKKLNPIFVKKIDVDQNSILSKRQLKYLVGGYGDPGGSGYGESGGSGCSSLKKRYSCSCVGAIGSWEGCYYTQTSAEDAGYNWCSNERPAECSPM